MSKTIIIFGAGTGLSASIAQLYGKAGYKVALIARNREKLKLLTENLLNVGVDAYFFIADLTSHQQIKSVILEVYNSLNSIDVIYYAPNPNDHFIPANKLTSAMLESKMNLYLYGLINTVQETLPYFYKNNSGTILSAIGGTAVNGYPFMSGIGIAMAGTRNYLQSLQKELIIDNIKVGLITISAQIQNSQNYELNKGKGDTQFPIVHPDDLAKMLRDVSNDPNTLEINYP